MAFHAAVLNILIASPSDLTDERKSARTALHEWNDLHAEAEGVVLLPMGWESHATPQAGARPQAVINKQLVANADILIGVFWTKIGTHTGAAESGTVEEINHIVTAGKRAMLYFSTRPVDPNKIDLKQMKKLKTFKSETYDNALTGTFASPDEFRQILMRDITRLVREMKAKWSAKRATEEPTTEPEFDVEAPDEFSDLDRTTKLTRDFYKRFVSGGFHGIYQPDMVVVADLNNPSARKPRDAYLLLSVIPMDQRDHGLDMAVIERSRPPELRPIGDDPYSLDGYGRSLVVQDEPDADVPRTSVMELNDAGCIFAALRLLVWPQLVRGHDAVNLEVQERMLLKSLSHYVRLLRKVGIVGLLDVRVILHGMNDVYVWPLNATKADEGRYRPLVDGTIFSTPVTLDMVDEESPDAIATAMRKAFQVIWRDAGYQHDQCYDEAGRFLAQ